MTLPTSLLLFETPILTLPKSKGGYAYVPITDTFARSLSRGVRTRLLCLLDGEVELRCGLVSMGNGSFYIIIARRHLQTLGKIHGDRIVVDVCEDPNPLGADIPEVLTALLEDDPPMRALFESFTDGRKRTLIHTIERVKNQDLKIQKMLHFLEEERRKRL